MKRGPAGDLLRRELSGRRRELARIAAWSAVEALPQLLSGLLVSAAIDRFLAGRVAGGIGLLALLVPAAVVGMVATRRLFPWLAEVVEPVRDAFLTASVAAAVTAATRTAGRPEGAEVVRVTGQVQTVRNILFALLRSARQVAFTVVAALVGLVLLAPVVAGVTAVLAGSALAVLVVMLPRLATRQRALLDAREELARRAGGTFDGIRDAIACGAAGRAVSDVGRAADQEAERTVALARATAVRTVLVCVGGQLPLVALLMAAPWLLREGRLSAGELVGAATYLIGGLQPALRQIVGVVSSFGPALIVCLDRLGEVFAAAGPVPAPHADAAPAGGNRCDLAVRGLTFRYGASAAPVVADLDLDLADGEHLAVVGVSGVGKSTLANLLAGLLRPDRGAVRLGGVDIDRLPAPWLRTRVALIPQEAYVFAGTLRENLVYLAPEADDRAVSRAVREVGLEPMVDRLGGPGARVGAGGADLSHGERQLVALARVHLSPARLVILDEATSNLDPAAEAQAEEALAGRPGSLIVVAHRISSARRADRILLLDDDRARHGTHADLLACSERYAELVGRWSVGLAPDRPRGHALR